MLYHNHSDIYIFSQSNNNKNCRIIIFSKAKFTYLQDIILIQSKQNPHTYRIYSVKAKFTHLQDIIIYIYSQSKMHTAAVNATKLFFRGTMQLLLNLV